MSKVLIIEDSEDLCEMLTIVLKTFKYKVITSAEDINVNSVLSNFNPDVVLIDVWLRNTSGKELCKQIKAVRHDFPVILMSANPRLLDDYESCNANDIIEKPFEIKDLLFKIDKALSNKVRFA